MRRVALGSLVFVVACAPGDEVSGSAGSTSSASVTSQTDGATVAMTDGSMSNASVDGTADDTADTTGGQACMGGVGPWPGSVDSPWPASRTPLGMPLGSGGTPSLSADGRLVAFTSTLDPSTGMPPVDSYGFHVYLYDGSCDTTTRIDYVPEHPPSQEIAPAISADGSTVVFLAHSGEGTTFTSDVFAYDVATEAIELISVLADGRLAESYDPAVSADGRVVAFRTITPSPDYDTSDVFVRDRDRATTEWIGMGVAPSISADGSVIAYALDDVSVHDRTTGQTETVSLTLSGTMSGESGEAVVSGDGRFVAFSSTSPMIVENDTNAIVDVFVHDRETGTTERVSLDDAGAELAAPSYALALSADGSRVLILLGLLSTSQQGAVLWLRDRDSGTLSRVSENAAGESADDHVSQISISPDGAWAAFVTKAKNLVDPPERLITHDVWVTALP